jgi:hypothetical protein
MLSHPERNKMIAMLRHTPATVQLETLFDMTRIPPDKMPAHTLRAVGF